jgi:hypothetical protein
MSDPDPFAEAERLVRAAQEAAEQAAAAQPELSALFGLVEALKGSVPPDLLNGLTDALRDLLLALRAVLDYSIARLERPPEASVQVEDIPIE